MWIVQFSLPRSRRGDEGIDERVSLYDGEWEEEEEKRKKSYPHLWRHKILDWDGSQEKSLGGVSTPRLERLSPAGELCNVLWRGSSCASYIVSGPEGSPNLAATSAFSSLSFSTIVSNPMFTPEELQTPRPRPPAQFRRSTSKGHALNSEGAPPPPYMLEFPSLHKGAGCDTSDPVVATAKMMGIQLEDEIELSPTTLADVSQKSREELANLFLQAEKIIRARETGTSLRLLSRYLVHICAYTSLSVLQNCL